MDKIREVKGPVKQTDRKKNGQHAVVQDGALGGQKVPPGGQTWPGT
jgi:hypothetical protein